MQQVGYMGLGWAFSFIEQMTSTPVPTNRGGSNTTYQIITLKSDTGGIPMILPNVDYLSATIDIENYDKVTKAIRMHLEEMKEAAKINSKDGFGNPTIVQLRTRVNEPRWIDFEILPNGSRGHAYILHNDSFEIKIAQYKSRNEEIYPIQIRIKSEILWSLGVFDAWNELRNIIESSIGKIKATKISRLDLACHTDTIQFDLHHLEDFKGNFQMDQVHRDNRQVTEINFGSRQTKKIYVRIYDKMTELAKKRNKNWFFDIWEKNGFEFDSDIQNRVWNIEYELNRELFTELSINTVEEALDQIGSIWIYCTCKHLVLMANDKTRIERSDVQQCWIEIQHAYDNYDGAALIRRKRQLNNNADALMPAICGYITSFASKLGMIDFDEIIEEIKERGLDYIENRKGSTVQDEVIEKAKLIYNIN